MQVHYFDLQDLWAVLILVPLLHRFIVQLIIEFFFTNFISYFGFMDHYDYHDYMNTVMTKT